MDNRINYLDYLKAFAIITVVIYHQGLMTEPVMQAFVDVQMPIFFLVSGFLTYRAENYNPLHITKKRAKQLLLPLLFCGIGLACLRDVDYLTYLTSQGKKGYWFLLTLFEVSLIYNLSVFIRNRLNNEWRWTIDIAIICLLMGLRFFMPDFLIETLELRQLSKFYPIFIFGVYLKEYPFIIRYMKKWNFIFIPLLAYNIIVTVPHNNLLLIYIIQVTQGIIGALFAWYIFMIYEEKMPLKRVWSYIGRHSLEIYLVHFFFLFPAKEIFVTSYFAVNIVLSVLYSGSVIFATLLICKLISSIRLLNILILGGGK